MKGIFMFFTIFGTIVFLAIIAEIPVVFLNLTYTFKDLTSADIPYYNNASASYDRYGAMWWVVALDVLRFAGPAVASYSISLVLLDKNGALATVSFYAVAMVILTLLEVAKVVIYTWQFVYCQDYQFCRNFDPSGNPEDANYVFYIMWIYSMAFLVIFIIYAFLAETLKKEFMLQLFMGNGKEDSSQLITMDLGHNQRSVSKLNLKAFYGESEDEDEDEDDYYTGDLNRIKGVMDAAKKERVRVVSKKPIQKSQKSRV